MKLDKKLKKEQQLLQSLSQFQALPESLQPEFERLCLISPWLMNWLKQEPDWQTCWAKFEEKSIDVSSLESLATHWTLADEPLVMKDLRCWRNREMARLIARDALHLQTVRETARDVSDMADVALRLALDWATQFWAEKEGAPSNCPFSDKPQELIVIAMGKHGAQELNLSSDIDLIFAFPEAGETQNGRDNEVFFTRVGRKLIQLLDTRTSDGFVFRVDMRLRPWGQSGALVSNFKALQNYYLQQGRFWERYALVKARAVTGAETAKAALDGILHPFVYRRYVDFQAVGALRDLKAKIRTEVRRQNLDRNIKLGAGGIREVEFIAQVFQLIRGGQDDILQTRGTWPILRALSDLELLPSSVVAALMEAYDFLRDLEHRIQALRDEQTQMLPVDESDLIRLALSTQHSDVDSLLSELTQQQEVVEEHFGHLISEEDASERLTDESYLLHWQNISNEKTENELHEYIQQFAALPGVERMAGEARKNLDRFMPMLWAELAKQADGASRFAAIQPILESVLRRSSYFALLAENPYAIHELVKLVPASKWIAEQIQDKPFLLDELTDKKSLYQLPNRSELMDELHQLLLRVPEDDLERQMELLRHFRHGRVLRAAACEVTAHLPLMKISDYLAWVAEVVVEQSLALVWRQMITRHGRPSRADGDWCDTDFGVIAYGKMGGLELSYESDLDLVFLHNAAPQGMTEGPKPIENVVFMARLGQKLIHMMSSVTPSGMLYEVDTRLRPSGNSGLLVSSMAAFKKYQQEQAWTWEHQALVRARFIAGDLSIQRAFDEYRMRIVRQNRDPSSLKTDVIEMRQKMLDHLSTAAKGDNPDEIFHLKHDRGGIVDLEFLVQFLVLANAHEHEDLAVWSDNVRSIEALCDADVICEDERDAWLSGYLELRKHVHHAILDGHSKQVPVASMEGSLATVRQAIATTWQRYFGD